MSNASKKILQNTSDYLKNYLTPYKSWDKKITLQDKIKKIRQADVDWNIVSRHIKDMKYHNFLKTPYWKAIAAHTKYKAGYRCQLCNSTDDLVTHHRTYAIHGREHASMKELTVMCDDCHSRFHDKVPKYKRKNRSLVMAILLLMLLFFPFYNGEDVKNHRSTSAYTERFAREVVSALKQLRHFVCTFGQ